MSLIPTGRPLARALPVLVVASLVACEVPAPEPSQPPQDDLQPTATVEDLMRSLVDPAADAIWDAVVITSTAAGLDERRPETDDDWNALERSAVVLAESGNLLQVGDRPIAAAGSVSELPGVDLEPGDIAARVAADPRAWARSARELRDAGSVTLKAVRARDVDALLASGDRLYVACENCHSRFWYPDDSTTSVGPTTSASPSR